MTSESLLSSKQHAGADGANRSPALLNPGQSRIPFPLALGLGALSAWLTSCAFPGFRWWPCVFLGLIGLLLAVLRQGFWKGTTIGLVFGVVYYGSLMHWLTLYLGPVPWIALALCLGSFTAIGIGIAAGVSRLFGHHLVLNALSLALILAGREVISNNVPYGGLGWGRVGTALSGSPLQSIASWIGITGTSVMVFWVSGIVAYLIDGILHRQARDSHPTKISALPSQTGEYRRQLPQLVGAASTIVILAVAWLVPAWGSLHQNERTLRVAAVQGNAKAGLMANPIPGTFLNHQVEASQGILDKRIDVMIWPENASDLNPLTNAYAREQITAITHATQRPLIFGAIRENGDELFNSSILWTPQGPQQIYDKERPVPFAEYMPNRAFFHAIAPSLVDLITHNYAFGKASGIMRVDDVKLGMLICFESSIDDLVNNRVQDGAQILIVQSNNADFGYSVEAQQQFAITRMQAIATGRSIVNISTVAASAVVYPDGSVHHELAAFKPRHFIANVPVRNGTTPALWLNRWVEGMSIVAVIGGGLAYLLSRWRARAAARRSCK